MKARDRKCSHVSGETGCTHWKAINLSSMCEFYFFYTSSNLSTLILTEVSVLLRLATVTESFISHLNSQSLWEI